MTILIPLSRTGPAGQVNMMGYAKPEQTTAGIHQRLRARAFLFGKKASGSQSSLHTIPLRNSQQIEPGMTAWERWMMHLWGHESSSSSSQTKSFSRSSLRSKQNVDPVHLLDATQTVCFVSIDTGMGSDLLNMRVLERLQTLLPEEAQTLCTIENLSISGTHTHR